MSPERVFESAELGIQNVNPSAGDRELIAKLEGHGAMEGEVLDRYKRLSEQTPSPAVRYLVGLILDDERRHHKIIEEIANTIAWGGFAKPDEVDVVPDITTASASPELLGATRQLLNIEKRDAKELRRLRRDLNDYARTTIWALLVDIMLLDTKKHQTILEFIEKNVAKE